MNRYIIDGSLMTVERRETTHSLLRSAGDRTRWIANELLEHLCPAEALQLRAGMKALCLRREPCVQLMANHTHYGTVPLVAVCGKPTVEFKGRLFYNSTDYETLQIEGFLKAGFAVAVLWENGNPDATTRSKFDLVIE